MVFLHESGEPSGVHCITLDDFKPIAGRAVRQVVRKRRFHIRKDDAVKTIILM
jgi:hypothetical protein